MKKETDMDMKDYWLGFVSGICATLVASFLISAIHFAADHDYKDRLTIEYNNTENEYERKMVRDMVNGSGIETNFTYKDYHYGKYSIKYIFKNPK
jgi:hypothetical protein